MATFRFHFRQSKKAGSEYGKLFIRIIHARKFREIPTPFVLHTTEWEELSGKIVYHTHDPVRNDYLSDIEKQIRSDLSVLALLEKNLTETGCYTALDIAGAFRNTYLDKHNILAYCERVGRRLAGEGRVRTARAYRSAVRSLLTFRNGGALRLDGIDKELMRGYESHLKKLGLEMNTVSFYIRQIRALYHRAVADRLIEPKTENPFLGVYTGVHTSRKRALNAAEVKALTGVQGRLDAMFTGKSAGARRRGMKAALEDSLRYFNFCLEARGMSWVDMAFLKKSDLDKKMLCYRRRKTGRPLDIYITPNMRKIIRDFAARTKGSPYVFPVIAPGRGNELKQYETGLRMQNQRLAVLAEIAGIDKRITTHVSRHTWATVARDNGIDIPVISEMLGHSNINVTYRYLDSIDGRLVEKVTRKVAKAFGIAA